MVTVINLAASQGAAKLPAIATLAETVVDHGQASQADWHAVVIDGIVTILEFLGFVT